MRGGGEFSRRSLEDYTHALQTQMLYALSLPVRCFNSYPASGATSQTMTDPPTPQGRSRIDSHLHQYLKGPVLFFRKSKPLEQVSLVEVVPKATKTGFVFWNINDDLGKASEDIMASTPLVKMTYGYARRSAMAALHIQGLVNADQYAHATAIFKSLQVQTGRTVEFQENAARLSDEFMQTYAREISGLFTKKVIAISLDYEFTGERMNDADFFAEVVETIFAEQEAARTGVLRT